MSDAEIAKPFIKATQAVLSMMAQIDPKPGKPYVKKVDRANGDVSAVMGLTGDKNGSFSITFPKKLAVVMVKNMLGDDIHDIVADAKDAVGEITNMICGQARVGLTQMGLSLSASTPTIIFGDNHTISHVNKGPVVAIPFTTPDGEFTLEFCFS
jgi:chemotaxis protein CheX